MAEGEPAQYFRRTSLFWMLSVTFGVAHLTCIVFAPGQIPFHYFGPYGSFCRYLVDHHAGSLYKGWWACLAVHVVEAFVALKVCRNKGISNMTTRCLWFVQTFLFGFASLGLLFRYHPKRPKRH
ncbi:transmembrane protein 254 isoform X2 [Brachionichthys hirsutus]|uniref:transmembrane protein 254 isoform X2 n=1 Tax=Brachionichthys hirsutus TaxID=412623 RepID=UPI003604ADAD